MPITTFICGFKAFDIYRQNISEHLNKHSVWRELLLVLCLILLYTHSLTCNFAPVSPDGIEWEEFRFNTAAQQQGATDMSQLLFQGSMVLARLWQGRAETFRCPGNPESKRPLSMFAFLFVYFLLHFVTRGLVCGCCANMLSCSKSDACSRRLSGVLIFQCWACLGDQVWCSWDEKQCKMMQKEI